MEEEESDERQVLCSGCLQVKAESAIHVIPRYNSSAGGYVTTFNCEQCWLPTLEEARARLNGTEDLAEIESLAQFFHRHGFYLHEFLRGDPIADLRWLLDRMLGMVRDGTIKLSIGRTVEPTTDEKRS
jgi:GNAT superfamily N-acetyltransferase